MIIAGYQKLLSQIVSDYLRTAISLNLEELAPRNRWVGKLSNCHGCYHVTNKLYYNHNSKQTMRGVILSLVPSGASSTTMNYYCCTCPAV